MVAETVCLLSRSCTVVLHHAGILSGAARNLSISEILTVDLKDSRKAVCEAAPLRG